jgi:hypothetical protein
MRRLTGEGPWLGRIEYSPNLQALSAFRILFAAYLLAHFAGIQPFYQDFYGPAGIMPLATLAAGQSVAGITNLLPLVRLADALGIGAIVQLAFPLSLVALAAGYHTRWACGIAFALNAYLFWRNPYVATGAEILARLLLLWCLFLPINRYWSIDAALDRLPRRRSWPALPFFAIRLQIASLYFFSAMFKLEGTPWQNGYALVWTLQDTLFAATSAGLFFVEHLPGVLVAVNYLVIAFQLSFPYLIYSPWRNGLTRAVAISGSVLMHLSFIAFLNIGGFPYLCLIMLVLLVPDAWIDRMLRKRRDRLRGVTIYFEPGCEFCEKVARLFREFLLVPEAKVLPATADNEALRLLDQYRSWVVVDPKGEAHLKWRAVAYVLAQCPLTAPIGWLTDTSVLRPLMARLYDQVGSHRRALGAVTRRLLPFRSERAIGRFALLLNGLLMVLALLCNLVSLDQWSVEHLQQEIHLSRAAGLRRNFEELVATAQVRQVWALFSPTPAHRRWSFEFSALDAAGNATNVNARMPFLAPSDGEWTRFNHTYWVRYFSRYEDITEPAWTALGAYLCRAVAGLQPPAAGVELTIEIVPAPHTSPEAASRVRRRSSCPPAGKQVDAGMRAAPGNGAVQCPVVCVFCLRHSIQSSQAEGRLT